MEEKHAETLTKLTKMLEEDESFRKKFNEIFDTDERITFQVVEKERAETKGGCSCWPYVCGKGCFAGYPGAKGHVVG